MIRCYDKMGNLDLRDDTQRVFVANYPNSKYLKPGGEKHWYNFFAKKS
jgi:outer membrane protein assembly factor BamD